MRRRRFAGKTTRYNFKQMATPDHPLDAALRAFLAAYKPNEKQIATRIGRSQSWLNKYLRGKGKATVDDVVRLTAIIALDVDHPFPLTAGQRKLVQAFAAAPPGVRAATRQLLAAFWPQHVGPPPKSAARSGRKNHAAAGKASGTR